MIGFALRTWLASMLALYTAYICQLESPVWSLLTVWIVSQPSAGMLLSKSLYRVIGTLAGAGIAVVLISLFAQTPELFVLTLALLVGGCTLASGILTNFRAYATVLTAYTAGIVAAGAIDNPDQIFFIAMSRSSAILIGIASAIVVALIFAPHRSEKEVRGKILEALRDAFHRAGFPWHGDNEIRIQLGRKLIRDVIALNTDIEYAAAESATFRLQANNARSLLANLFGVISARRSLDAHLMRCGWPPGTELECFHKDILEILAELPEKLDRSHIETSILRLQKLRGRLKDLHPEEEESSPAEIVSERLVIDRLDDLLAHLESALETWIEMGEWLPRKRPRLVLNFHHDQRAAVINGLRAFIAVVATGAFWIGSAWPNGPGALIFVCIMMSLFASFPRPDRIGWAFFKMSMPAIAMALLVRYVVLPMGSGFEFLVLGLGLFLFPLGLFMAHPSTNTGAVSFSLVFLNLIGVPNLMTYDLSDSLNSALGIVMGILFGTLAYQLIFPPNPESARRYVTYRIRVGLEKLASLKIIPPVCGWETRMYDRVYRLYDPQNPSATTTNEWLEAGLGALTLGNEILRLRGWLASGEVPDAMIRPAEKAIGAFANFHRDPQHATREVKIRGEQIFGLDPGSSGKGRRAWARLVGALKEIDIYLANHPRLSTLKWSASHD